MSDFLSGVHGDTGYGQWFLCLSPFGSFISFSGRLVYCLGRRGCDGLFGFVGFFTTFIFPFLHLFVFLALLVLVRLSYLVRRWH